MHKHTAEAILQELQSLRVAQAPLSVVHYACESFFEVRDRPVAVSCICFADVATGRVIAYSQIDREDDRERYVLDSFFSYLSAEPERCLLHWNMTSSDFGFRALENRYYYLTKQDPPWRPRGDRTHDLDELLASLYGHDYADHPRMRNVFRLNACETKHFLEGREETERFKNGQHGDIRRSVTEKAQLLARLTRLLLDGTLETKTAGPRLRFADASVDAVRVLVTIGERFLDVSRQLLRRYGKPARPTLEVKDEYDAQDLFHSLLRLFFEDVRPEDGTPSAAGASARIDFLLPQHRIAVELKYTRSSMTAKDLGDEIAADVQRYPANKNIRHLVCLVFDEKGIILNPRGIEHDLSRQYDFLAVTVRIIDR